MPFLDRPGYRLFYRTLGKAEGTPLILSHSLGSSSALWEPQLPALKDSFRIILFDHPGHGRSSKRPARGTISDYGNDVLALMDRLGIEKAHYCGLSLGGMVGIWLGSVVGPRFHRLVLCNTTAKIEDSSLLRERIDLIRKGGLELITDSVLEKWLSPNVLVKRPDILAKVKTMLLAATTNGYADTAEMICSMDLRPMLESIVNRVLVIYGTRDKATPPAWNIAIADGAPHAKCFGLETSHLSNMEQPEQFNSLVLKFLLENTPAFET